MAFTLATPEEAAAPVEFILPKLPAVQLPNTKYADKSLPHYSRKKDGPLVIHVPILDGISPNTVNDTVSNVVTPNTYTATEGSAGYGYASGSASAGSASSSSTNTALCLSLLAGSVAIAWQLSGNVCPKKGSLQMMAQQALKFGHCRVFQECACIESA